MTTVNEYFDKVYCLNLDRRPDRKAKCVEIFDKLGIEVEFFSAIDKEKIENTSRITTGQLACLSSHYNIIRKAKKYNQKRILIFEDDVIFSDKFNEVFSENIENVPDDWKMLYFGGNHLNGKTPIADNVLMMMGSLTTHAYAVNDGMYDIILDKLQHCMWPVDIYYAHIHRDYPSYVIQDGDSQLVWQDDGYSDIDESECSYTWLK
jgi:GR25 family glycosyltransferase involved in LPS biosynthesis